MGFLDSIRYGIAKTEHKKIILSKPIDRSGETCGALWTVACVTKLDLKHYRHLHQNYPENYNKYERDMALLILLGQYPKNDIIKNSLFYDLDTNRQLPILPNNFQYHFFQGASSDSEIKNDDILNTGMRVASNGQKKVLPRSKLEILDIPLNENYSLKGSSGAGLWIFCKINETVSPILHGAIVESYVKQNITRVIAINLPYISDDFLPNMKKIICKNKLMF